MVSLSKDRVRSGACSQRGWYEERSSTGGLTHIWRVTSPCEWQHDTRKRWLSPSCMSDYSIVSVSGSKGFSCFSQLRALEWMCFSAAFFTKTTGRFNLVVSFWSSKYRKRKPILIFESFFWNPSLMLMQLGLVCVLVNAVRGNTHEKLNCSSDQKSKDVEEADTGLALVICWLQVFWAPWKNRLHGHYFDRLYPYVATIHLVTLHPLLTLKV